MGIEVILNVVFLFKELWLKNVVKILILMVGLFGFFFVGIIVFVFVYGIVFELKVMVFF